MKPNFALLLSHEGVRLLHRTPSGWMAVGEAALDDPDLTHRIKVLRQTAVDLGSGGFSTKLVIPPAQILYTRLPAPGPTEAERAAQVRRGLDGLTPYALEELQWDWVLQGDTARVAAVARETLDEAEAFATEHRFNPVCFVAQPDAATFPREPYFGETRHAASLLGPGETVERDRDPVRQTGAVPKDTGPVAADAGPAAPAPPKPAPSTPAAAPPKKPAPPAAKPPAARSAAKPGSAKGGPTWGQARKGEPAAPKPPEPAAAAKAPAAKAAPPAASGKAAAAAPSFSTRRDTGHAPAGKSSLDRVPSRLGVAPASDTPPPLDAAEPATLRAEPPAKSAAGDGPAAGTAKAATGTPPGANGRAGAPLAARLAQGRKALSSVKAPALGIKTPKIGKPRIKAPKVRVPPVKMPEVRLPDLPQRSAVDPEEAEKLTLFGARKEQQIETGPRHLGLILTGGLIAVMALVAVGSVLFFGGDDGDIAATEPETPPATASAPADAIAPAEPLDAGPAPEADVAAVPPPPAEVPAPEEETAALAGPPAAPEDSPLGPIETESLPGGDTAADEGVSITPREESVPAGDTAPAGPAEPAPPEEPPVVAQPLNREAAEATYAATGIWPLSPEPGAAPESGRLDDLQIASIDPVMPPQDATALPAAPDRASDARPAPLPPPAPPGTEFDLDERGLVRATPDGALSPEGVMVYAGPPPVTPGPRPDGLGPVPDERLRDLRPPPRPEDLIESDAETVLGGQEETAVADASDAADTDAAARAAVEPEETAGAAGETPAEEAAPERADGAAAETETDPDAAEQPAADDPIGGTDLAVRASPGPVPRPEEAAESFRVARAAAAPRDPPAQDVPAPAVPAIATPATVAREATVENALPLGRINLIGVYGAPNERRALVRLPSGDYRKVKVGDEVDGGQIAAIGDDRLQYVKRGRNITLRMPSG